MYGKSSKTAIQMKIFNQHFKMIKIEKKYVCVYINLYTILSPTYPSCRSSTHCMTWGGAFDRSLQKQFDERDFFLKRKNA